MNALTLLLIAGGAGALYFGKDMLNLANAGEKLKTDLTGFDFTRLDGITPIFTLKTTHRNPTGKAITLDSIFLDVLYDGSPIGQVNLDIVKMLSKAKTTADREEIRRQFTIQANTITNIPLEISVSPIGAGMKLIDLITKGKLSELPKSVTISGDIKAQGVSVPYNSVIGG